MNKRTFDVAIVGGGVIGASAAHYLGRRGLRVAIVERGRGPSGASVACDGFVFLQSKSVGPTLELAKQSRAMFEGLADELEADVEFVSRGGLILARSPAELEFLAERSRALASAGVEAQVLSVSETFDLEPGLSRQVVGASYCAADGQVNPLRLVRAFLSSARRSGVEVLNGRPVTAMEPGATGFVLTCGEERVTAERIVIAAGAWSKEVGAMLGIDIPVKPRRGQLVVTEPAPPILARPVMTAGYLMAKSGGAASDDGVSVEQTEAGSFLLGSTREFVGFETGTTPQGIASILARAASVLPSLRKLSVIRSYAGLRPYCDHGHPIIGPAPDHPNAFVATGHEGDGIALAPVTGKLIADLIVSGRPGAAEAAV